MKMTSKNERDKALNASLIAFNQHIVSIKSVVKKAKVNEIQKLIRKIKLLTNKKGNETQIEKNKRKCLHLKTEINLIKSLKFNEIAIFAIENNELTFDSYLKTNKNLTPEQISMGRIGFNKLVLDSINKMKTDTKIDGWKHTFIQYKARSEKRKSWKEKTKQLKDIEAKLNLNNEEEVILEKEVEEPNEVNSTDDEDQVKEIKQKKSILTKNIEEKSKPIQREVKFSEDESSNEEEKLILTKNNKAKKEKSKPIQREVKFSDDESLDEDEDEENMNEMRREVKFSDDESSMDDDDDEEDDGEISEFEIEKFEIKPKEEKIFKPLVFENKPSRMEIKQLNLDELTDISEIPIFNKTSVSDDEDESIKQNSNQESKIVPITSDPFFLDKNGKEIHNLNFDYELHENDSRQQSFRRNNESSNYNNNNRYNNNYNNGNRDEFRNKRDSLNSSYTNSLSSNRPSYNNNKREERPSFNRFKSSNDQRPSYNRDSFQRRPNVVQRTAPAEDLSKLHPSWQAKKLMEDKLKNMKFEGKKLKFDD